MFAQIVRAFASKASTPKPAKTAGRYDGLRVRARVPGYFQALGYPLLRASDYPASTPSCRP